MNSQYIPDHGTDVPQFPTIDTMATSSAAGAIHLGSTNSSPVSFDEDTNMMTGTTPNWQHIPATLPPRAPSTPASTVSSAPSKAATLPLQKRRRVTRACDECRRKKIKCDGKQPCTHCTVYSYECTYDQPSNRRRNPAPQYIEALESRLQRTEAFLKALLPDIDVNHPDFDPVKIIPQIQASVQAQALEQLNVANSPPPNAETQAASQEKDPVLETMVKAAGRLDIDEAGHLDFHGHSSGLTYLSHLNHQFDNILGEMKVGFPGPKSDGPSPSPSALIQSPQSSENLPDISLLPSQEAALVLVDTCLDYACVMMRFIHRPSFMEMMNRVYDISPDNYEEAENTFLPLLYLALGVGCLFLHDNSKAKLENPKAEASKYFNAGRRMIEMTDIRDVNSLQAVLLMVIFLQSSARMSICYSYCCLALSAAVRMGMHRALPEARFNPVEREVRRRVFWTCWKMDTYVAALLGLPRGIQMEDVDQLMPADIDDIHITKDGISPQPEGKLSSMAPANAHTRLLMLMAKLVKYIYPLKGIEASVTGSGGGYAVSHTRLHEIEQDLARWLSELPPGLNFSNAQGAATTGDFQKCHWKYLLRMSYSHVQMMLYRPFVHYLTQAGKGQYDERSYKIALKCVRVSQTIVHITHDMKSVLPNLSSYWFTIYTTFFSVITLIYYVLVSPPDETALAILRDAKLGKECIANITEDSLAAKRCTLALEPLFARIPEKVTELEAAVLLNKSNTPTSSLLTASDHDDRHFDSRSSSGTSSPTEFASRVPSTESRSILPSPQLQSAAERRLTKKRSYMCDTTEPGSQTSLNQDPSMRFQAHLSGAGLPDLNVMMFPPQDPFSFAGTSMEQSQPFTKTETIGSPLFSPGGSTNPYGSLQGNIFGPLPPYLLQGQHAMSIDSGCGIGIGDQRQTVEGDGNATSSPSMGQFLMGMGGGGEAMIPDFFKDEWDDVLMQQTFRN